MGYGNIQSGRLKVQNWVQTPSYIMGSLQRLLSLPRTELTSSLAKQGDKATPVLPALTFYALYTYVLFPELKTPYIY